MAVIARFYRRVISCVLARRGVRRGAPRPVSAAPESSTCGHDNTVGATSIFDKEQFVD